jgi:RimJ/RimL family protein N-acetyltransferase
MKVLETPRLRLRARTLEDLDAIVAMDADEEVRRYIGGPLDPITHGADVRRRIVDGRPAPYFAWAIEWKAWPGFLGQCALNASHLPDVTEISWRLTRMAWGQGIATEAATAVFRHALHDLEIGPVVAMIHPDNRGSVRVAEKIGLRQHGETQFKGVRQLVFRTSERLD